MCRIFLSLKSPFFNCRRYIYICDKIARFQRKAHPLRSGTAGRDDASVYRAVSIKRDSTSGCQRRREPLCTWLMGAQGGWMSLGIFLGWATGKSTLRRGCLGLFWIGSLRVRLREGRQYEGSKRKSGAEGNKRERKRERERERWKGQNRMWPGLVNGGEDGRGQKPSARICYAPWILDASRKREPFIGKPGTRTICPASRGSRKLRTSLRHARKRVFS